MKSKIVSLNYQIICSFFFIISVLVSIYITYEEKLELLNKKRICSKKIDSYINLFNKVFALLLITSFFLINYNDFKNRDEKSNYDALLNQVIASLFSIVSSVIVLYVVIDTFDENLNISSVENPIT